MLLHIGYHKTATTWLQRHVFDRSAGSYGAPCPFLEQIDQLVRPHPLEWDEDAVRAFFRDRVAAVESAGLVCAMSNEAFSGNPHAGGYQNVEIARRLHAVFPEAQVLVVIRRQEDQVLSSYKQYVQRGGCLAPDRYFDHPHNYFRIPGFRYGHFAHDQLIRLYQELFGRERVLVLPYEWMLKDRDDFLRRIFEFSGARPLGDLPAQRERASLSAAAIALQRRLNRYFLRDDVNRSARFHVRSLPVWMRRADRLLAPVLGRWCEAALRRQVHARVAGRYAESNQRTVDLTGLPLAELGYERPPTCAGGEARPADR